MDHVHFEEYKLSLSSTQRKVDFVSYQLSWFLLLQLEHTSGIAVLSVPTLMPTYAMKSHRQCKLLLLKGRWHAVAQAFTCFKDVRWQKYENKIRSIALIKKAVNVPPLPRNEQCELVGAIRVCWDNHGVIVRAEASFWKVWMHLLLHF